MNDPLHYPKLQFPDNYLQLGWLICRKQLNITSSTGVTQPMKENPTKSPNEPPIDPTKPKKIKYQNFFKDIAFV